MALVKLKHIRNTEKDGMFAKVQFSIINGRCTANLVIGAELVKMIDSERIPVKVDIFHDENNPYFLVLRAAKSEKDSYSLRLSKGDYYCSFTWRWEHPKTKEDCKTKKIMFDTHPEGGIQLELNREFVPYPGG